ncbi:hypothetical protein PROFUN_00242 [Planoprotostelium fungivorum]|uniref:Uncharacterized protein n=1 Tax=Planoprotostelium fungivorum TaxID=1890364 RepID=A0A2P6NXT9_9EUKA|nr:hypothetical protein PROFUN_00242 [Planoprotostelium fungivorum]
MTFWGKLSRRDRDKKTETSNFLSRQIRKMRDKTETQIFMSLQVLNKEETKKKKKKGQARKTVKKKKPTKTA